MRAMAAQPPAPPFPEADVTPPLAPPDPGSASQREVLVLHRAADGGIGQSAIEQVEQLLS